MKAFTYLKFSAVAVLLFALGACSVDNASVNEPEIDETPLTESFTLQIENNQEVLASRTTIFNEDITAKVMPAAKSRAEVANFSFNRLYRLDTPSLDNLSATHILTNSVGGVGNVLYHRNDSTGLNPGDAAGSIQFITPSTGAVRQEVAAESFEWNHLHPSSGSVFITGDSPRGASLFRIPLFNDIVAGPDSNTVVNLHGPTANASWVSNGVLYVAVGGTDSSPEAVLEDGRGVPGIYALNASDLTVFPEIEPITGLKQIYSEFDDNGNRLNPVFLRNAGSSSELIEYDNNSFADLDLSSPAATYTGINQMNPTDGRNGIFIDNGIAYISLGDNGLVAYNLSTNTVVDQMSFAGEDILGEYVNAVYGDDNYLYVAAGSALIIVGRDANNLLNENDSYTVPLSALVGDVNGDGNVNVDDVRASRASVNYATQAGTTSNGRQRVLVACGRFGMVAIDFAVD